jgi:hypothetical protein
MTRILLPPYRWIITECPGSGRSVFSVLCPIFQLLLGLLLVFLGLLLSLDFFSGSLVLFLFVLLLGLLAEGRRVQ